MNTVKHFITITHHRWLVRHYCFKVGLFKQGLLHDLSKYSPTEFFKGVKYFRGVGSPIAKERQINGYSLAWLHHKGRNKHHAEYWVDLNKEKSTYLPIPMPKKYIVESLMDHIAASKVYNKKNFEPIKVKEYFEKEIAYVPYHEETKEELRKLIDFYVEHSMKETYKFIKKTYLKK